MPEMLVLVAVIVVVAIVLVSVFFRYVPLGLWINARASGAPVCGSTPGRPARR